MVSFDQELNEFYELVRRGVYLVEGTGIIKGDPELRKLLEGAKAALQNDVVQHRQEEQVNTVKADMTASLVKYLTPFHNDMHKMRKYLEHIFNMEGIERGLMEKVLKDLEKISGIDTKEEKMENVPGQMFKYSNTNDNKEKLAHIEDKLLNDILKRLKTYHGIHNNLNHEFSILHNHWEKAEKIYPLLKNEIEKLVSMSKNDFGRYLQKYDNDLNNAHARLVSNYNYIFTNIKLSMSISKDIFNKIKIIYQDVKKTNAQPLSIQEHKILKSKIEDVTREIYDYYISIRRKGGDIDRRVTVGELMVKIEHMLQEAKLADTYNENLLQVLKNIPN